MQFIFRAIHPGSGRTLEVYSNQEGVQLYTTNFLPDPCGDVRTTETQLGAHDFHLNFRFQINPTRYVSENYYEVDGVLTTKLEQVNVMTKDRQTPRCSDDTAVVGKGGVHYLKHGAFCLETQKFPDAVHHVMRSQKCSARLPSINFAFSLSSRRKTSHRQFWLQDKSTSTKSSSSSAPNRIEILNKKKLFSLSPHMTMGISICFAPTRSHIGRAHKKLEKPFPLLDSLLVVVIISMLACFRGYKRSNGLKFSCKRSSVSVACRFAFVSWAAPLL